MYRLKVPINLRWSVFPDGNQVIPYFEWKKGRKVHLLFCDLASVEGKVKGMWSRSRIPYETIYAVEHYISMIDHEEYEEVYLGDQEDWLSGFNTQT